ncbi:MAG TPA: aldo/keto reductase [Terriglobia bacterium]|nr:aldo/keto reductase [Terriglobia bacterium]
MEYKRLGVTDLKVSRVGFGGWAIGGHGWGKVDDGDSIRAIRKAYDLGINFFDTADIYGFGHSEEILCEALGEDRRKVLIATKFGMKWDQSGAISRDASASRVVEALEGSLRRLRLDCVALYQIHWPDPNTPLEETMEALKKCKEAGKIKYIGCSNFTPDLITRAQQVHRLESVQAPYSVIDRSIEGELLSCCERFEMGVVAYNPLAQGLLSGKFGPETQFGKDDVRSRSKYFQPGEFEKNLDAVGRLRKVASRYGKTPAQVALRWVLQHPLVTCVIPGIKKPEQIEDNAGAANGWELAGQDQAWLASGVEAGADAGA